jgi:hypothetical protein
MFTDLARPGDSRSRSGMPCVARAVGIVPGSRAFAAATAIVHETTGQAKIEVFRRILGEEQTAQRANRAFESAYADLLSAVG